MKNNSIKPRSEIKVVNVVCTGDLKQQVDITCFNQFDFLKTNLKVYRCGYVKTKNMSGRVTVFKSGKIISVGTKSIDFAIKELETASKLLKKYGLISKFSLKPQIRNIVSNIDLKRKIDLEKFARSIPKVMYEPEQFSGLVLRFSGSIVALIFASGKIILTGAKSYTDLNESYFELNKIF
jgi:transcription initiation factor TFIID TATA-box-binding protein